MDEQARIWTSPPTQQPVVMTVQNMVLGLAFAVTIGIFFGFYPAIRAARLNPIEALRYE